MWPLFIRGAVVDIVVDCECYRTHVQRVLAGGKLFFIVVMVMALILCQQGAYNGLNGVHGLAGWRCTCTRPVVFTCLTCECACRAVYHRRNYHRTHCPTRLLDYARYVRRPEDFSWYTVLNVVRRSTFEHQTLVPVYSRADRHGPTANAQGRTKASVALHEGKGIWLLQDLARMAPYAM